MNTEKKQNKKKLQDDELQDISGGTSLLPVDISGMIGFDPLAGKVDAEIIHADPTHEFTPEIDFDTDHKEHKTTYSLNHCPGCRHLIMPVVISAEDSHPTYCRFCGIDMHDFLFRDF